MRIRNPQPYWDRVAMTVASEGGCRLTNSSWLYKLSWYRPGRSVIANYTFWMKWTAKIQLIRPLEPPKLTSRGPKIDSGEPQEAFSTPKDCWPKNGRPKIRFFWDFFGPWAPNCDFGSHFRALSPSKLTPKLEKYVIPKQYDFLIIFFMHWAWMLGGFFMIFWHANIDST